MAIKLKTPEQIERMRSAGQLVRLVLNRLSEMVVEGVTTEELDTEAEKLCRASGAEPLFKGVPGRGKAGPFPGSICCSLNGEVVHGIPSPERAIHDGDIVSVDFGVRLDGMCGDAAETFVCGEVSADVQRLVDVTRQSLAIAVAMCKPDMGWSTVAAAMQTYVEAEGFSVVREFVGHGIGEDMWEDPKIPNYVSPELRAKDIMLTEGMVVAIEPMVNFGSAEVKTGLDGWTVVTRDGKPSAHFEHMLAITSCGVDVLTK